ncbi:MAG: hypothetical protein LHV69_07965 [Elusimicrobia bacterium]|nr:hypothetical protein [Candidatus Obscuribacterium magneticum]
MESRKSLFFFLILSVIIIVLAKWRIDARFEWKYPPLNQLVVTENYAGDVGALLLGARRLAADIAYIQFLQYYGVEEHIKESDSRVVHVTPWGHRIGHEEGGIYPRLKEFGERILMLDPYFNAAILEVAGALAFNQVRIQESLDLLQEAIQWDPSFYRYHLYATAILYRSNQQDEKLIVVLREAIQYRECPILLEQVLGNLLKKYGRYEEAARVFLHIIDTAPYESDRTSAQKKLESLLQQNPGVGVKLGL